jgi:hypothetical protein
MVLSKQIIKISKNLFHQRQEYEIGAVLGRKETKMIENCPILIIASKVS